jgi:hypothetical protein
MVHFARKKADLIFESAFYITKLEMTITISS